MEICKQQYVDADMSSAPMERAPIWRTWRPSAHTPMEPVRGGYETDDQAGVILVAGITLGVGTVEGLRAQAEKKPAYVIAEVQVSDPTAFAAYVAKVPATLAPYHGRYIVRGKPEANEGVAPQGAYVILAFDSLADAEK
jgi:hypothetical protein